MKIQGIILVQPKNYANVGGIARSMKAFNTHNLIIVNKLKHLRLDKARHISEQGKDIIQNIKVVEKLEDIKGTKIATISTQDNKKFGFALCSLKNIIFPEEFYLVMGREGSGLTEEEIKQCQKCLTINTHGKYGILNLCQATTIILHELYNKIYK